MGSDEEFTQAVMSTVSFGEGLGGPAAQYAIFDTADTCMSQQVATDLQDNAFMDDLLVLSYKDENISSIISEVDASLKQRNLAVKEWVQSGSHQQKDIKYLNYGWITSTDSIHLRPRINWSRTTRT